MRRPRGEEKKELETNPNFEPDVGSLRRRSAVQAFSIIMSSTGTTTSFIALLTPAEAMITLNKAKKVILELFPDKPLETLFSAKVLVSSKKRLKTVVFA